MTMLTKRYPARASKTLLAALLLASLVACGSSAESQTSINEATGPQITVYKSPTCSCCAKWVEHLQADGFAVEVVEERDLSTRKRQLSVPPKMASCHTAVVDDYVIEGHVPAADIRRLLSQRPPALGLAVPGMPVGSPGMEAGAQRDPYTAWLFDESVEPRAFASYGR